MLMPYAPTMNHTSNYARIYPIWLCHHYFLMPYILSQISMFSTVSILSICLYDINIHISLFIMYLLSHTFTDSFIHIHLSCSPFILFPSSCISVDDDFILLCIFCIHNLQSLLSRDCTKNFSMFLCICFVFDATVSIIPHIYHWCINLSKSNLTLLL